MRFRDRAISAAVALTLSATSSIASAYCIGSDKNVANYDPKYYSVDHEFRRSQWVVKAKVVAETWIGEDGRAKALQPPFQNGSPRPWGFDPYLGAFYTLRVENAYKGAPPQVFKVFSENATDRFWLKEGEEILAFVSAGKFDPPISMQLTLDTCGNLSRYPRAARVMPAVIRAAKAASRR